MQLSGIMIKKEKNITANTNARIQKIPFITSLPLKALIPCNKGKNINAIKPNAEPAPWIFDAKVTLSFDSYNTSSVK